MNLLFVENRFATSLYELVARQLAECGHEIHWLVQNPSFAPTSGTVHVIPFPRPQQVSDRCETDYAWLRSTDRGVRHFGVRDEHYSHYDKKISMCLDAISPDVVFGEATAFHELLTIVRARERNIPYLAPNATRYPTDRVMFMIYDTLDSIGGDGSRLTDHEADIMMQSIRERRVVPSYMRALARTTLEMKLVRLSHSLRVTRGWIAGERFNTPSPLKKIQLNREQYFQRSRWDDRSKIDLSKFVALVEKREPWVLYPLQMQPESNIDVFGLPWNDQAELIRRASRALRSCGATLVVKPNPKSKYEMSSRLNEIMESEANVLGLTHSTPMQSVFPHSPLVFTVTGTVLLESIFSFKPVACLGGHSMQRYPGVSSISVPEDLPGVLDCVKAGSGKVASYEAARGLLQLLHSTSYPAALWDPVSQPHLCTQANIISLTDAFKSVLEDYIKPRNLI